MATYTYRCERCGEQTEREYRLGRQPARVRCASCGGRAVRDIVADLRQRHRRAVGIWPHASWAMAVHPSQVKEYAEFDRKNGVPTEYNERGEPVLRSMKHRRKYMRLHGYVDYSGWCE